MAAVTEWHDVVFFRLPAPTRLLVRALHALAMEFPEANTRVDEAGRLVVRVQDDDDE